MQILIDTKPTAKLCFLSLDAAKKITAAGNANKTKHAMRVKLLNYLLSFAITPRTKANTQYNVSHETILQQAPRQPFGDNISN